MKLVCAKDWSSLIAKRIFGGLCSGAFSLHPIVKRIKNRPGKKMEVIFIYLFLIFPIKYKLFIDMESHVLQNNLKIINQNGFQIRVNAFEFTNIDKPFVIFW